MSEKNFTPAQLIDEAVDLAENVIEAETEDKVIEAVADFLDAMMPLDVIFPGPIGDALEERDGDAFEVVLKAIKKAFEVDPEKKAVRRAKRLDRRASRKARREERKAQRIER